MSPNGTIQEMARPVPPVRVVVPRGQHGAFLFLFFVPRRGFGGAKSPIAKQDQPCLLLGLPQEHTNSLIPRVSGGQPSSHRSGYLQPSSNTSPTSHSSWMQRAIPVGVVCGAFRGSPTLCSGCWGRHRGYGGLPSTTASAQGLPSTSLPLLFPHIPPLRSH